MFSCPPIFFRQGFFVHAASIPTPQALPPILASPVIINMDNLDNIFEPITPNLVDTMATTLEDIQQKEKDDVNKIINDTYVPLNGVYTCTFLDCGFMSTTFETLKLHMRACHHASFLLVGRGIEIDGHLPFIEEENIVKDNITRYSILTQDLHIADPAILFARLSTQITSRITQQFTVYKHLRIFFNIVVQFERDDGTLFSHWFRANSHFCMSPDEIPSILYLALAKIETSLDNFVD